MAGGGMVFLGFLIIVALVAVPINIYSNRKDKSDTKKRVAARKEQERLEPQRKENIAVMEKAIQQKKIRITNTSDKVIERMKNSTEDNNRAVAVMYVLQDLEKIPGFKTDNKVKNSAIFENILKVDPRYFQYLVDGRHLSFFDTKYMAPNGNFEPISEPELGEVGAFYTSPIFNELDSNLIVNAMYFDGNNLGFLPPNERSEELCRIAYKAKGARREAIKHMPENSSFLLELMQANPDEVSKHRGESEFYMIFYIKQKYYRYLSHHSINRILNTSLRPIVIELEKASIERRFIDSFLWDVCKEIIKERVSKNEMDGFDFEKFLIGLETYWEPTFTATDLIEYYNEQKNKLA